MFNSVSYQWMSFAYIMLKTKGKTQQYVAKIWKFNWNNAKSDCDDIGIVKVTVNDAKIVS